MRICSTCGGKIELACSKKFIVINKEDIESTHIDSHWPVPPPPPTSPCSVLYREVAYYIQPVESTSVC